MVQMFPCLAHVCVCVFFPTIPHFFTLVMENSWHPEGKTSRGVLLISRDSGFLFERFLVPSVGVVQVFGRGAACLLRGLLILLSLRTTQHTLLLLPASGFRGLLIGILEG